MSEVKQASFTLEDLPGILYGKLDDILAGTQYRSLQSLSGSSHEQIVLVNQHNLDLWFDINNGDDDSKPNGTMDLYHLKIDNQGNETRIPHLRFFCDILFGEVKIQYLQQPQVDRCYIPNKEQKGELDAYFYVLGWLTSLQDKKYW